MKVKLLKEIRIEGKAKKVGSTVEVSNSLAKTLIGTKRAAPVSDKAKPADKAGK